MCQGTVGITSKTMQEAMTIKGVVLVGVDDIFKYFEKSKDETEKLIRFSSFDVNKGFLSHLIDWSKGFTEDTIYCVESYMNVFPFFSFPFFPPHFHLQHYAISTTLFQELSQSFINWVHEKNKGQIFDQVVLKSDLDEFNEQKQKYFPLTFDTSLLFKCY